LQALVQEQKFKARAKAGRTGFLHPGSSKSGPTCVGPVMRRRLAEVCAKARVGIQRQRLRTEARRVDWFPTGTRVLSHGALVNWMLTF
jgi:hypothetical protein